MKDLLGIRPSKGNQGTTRGKEKILLTSVGIEPTTSGLDLPLLCRLSYEAGQRKSRTIKALFIWSRVPETTLPLSYPGRANFSLNSLKDSSNRLYDPARAVSGGETTRLGELSRLGR